MSKAAQSKPARAAPAKKVVATKSLASSRLKAYAPIRADITQLLLQTRLEAVRSVNSVMTATYWAIGQRIVQAEQQGSHRAKYGEQLIAQLAVDLMQEFGRGYGARNLAQMRSFYLAWPIEQIESMVRQAALQPEKILQTLSAKSSRAKPLRSILQTVSAKLPSTLQDIARAFPLPWSAYVCLLSVEHQNARTFYEAEALRGGWSVRQLARQIDTQFYERSALSRNKKSMRTKAAQSASEDMVSLAQIVKDPFVLEFLDLKDEYSEGDLEEALIRRLEDFLLELGDDFTFVGRQRRLRLDDEWFRVDLVFFHRGLKCLVLIDLKLGKFSHADAGQMHMYLNYAKAHWMREGENPPVGIILCSQKGQAQARYALEGLPNKVMATRYQTLLPSTERLALELRNASQEIQALRQRKSI